MAEASTSQQADNARRQAVNRVLFGTVDPTAELNGRPLPAMTTMLYRVCNNDEKKFSEATRIVELFINEALNHAAG